ncbi:hypothetical protein CCO03_08445 [Comamonas serinivorans]|uniref:Uncharacterized protein n=1 Tax=Comamonas serinivorans TaxID=1082851 RepID=A0A1Y0EN06_9BURK|nr:hypothetical protein [Comamonas serinivorans]ARU04699.1 hypothetical protein CCO03_08445 [Comamonas serinivorans]
MPMFKIWCPELGQSIDDAKTVKGFDHESAATNWADWHDHDSADYAIVGGEVAEVQVLHEGETKPVTVRVFGEMTRSYRARAMP